MLLPGQLVDGTGGASDIRFVRIDGLSHNTVVAITQDAGGFVWIGTPDGLNRFDGYEFVIYRNLPGDASSLSHNSIKSLLALPGGDILVGTDDGLNRFDPRRGVFDRIAVQFPEPPEGRVAIHHLLLDSQGRVWVASDHGVFRLESGADSQARYVRRDAVDAPGSEALAAARPTLPAWTVFEDQHGNVWVGASAGVLLRYDSSADVLRSVVAEPRWPQVTVHGADEWGNVWISDADQRGLLVVPSTTNSATNSSDLRRAAEVPERTIHTVLRDGRGDFWFGTDRGLYRRDAATGTMQHGRPVAAPVDFLQNNVKALFEDDAGALWVGTFSGLYRIDPHRKRFSHIGRDPADPNSLSGNTVMAIAEGDGELWVGTLGGGLNRLESRTRRVTHFRPHPSDPASICSDLVWSLFVDASGTLWVGTDDGICSKSRGTSTFVRHHLPWSRGRQPPVNAIREDSGGRIWVATNLGLYRIARTRNRIDYFGGAGRSGIGDGTSEGSATDSVLFLQSLHLASDGKMWVGAFGGGLYRFDPAAAEPRLERFPLAVHQRGELVSEGIWAIDEGRDGSLWLGSDLGLTRFDPVTGGTEHFSQHDGLPGSIVYAILESEAAGRLWLSTNRGLARFDTDTGAFRVFDAGDGLANTEFNRRAAARTRDGRLYFGGLAGLTWFQPADIRDNPYVPPVSITRIETSRRDTTMLVNPASVERLVLSYRDYTVSFGYTALSFTNPAQNRYAYLLEGFDEHWIESGARRFATYTNIPPGDYTFRVRGSNDDGVWNEIGASLAIRVVPPFWQTLWFRLAIAAVVAALLLAAHRYRVNRLLEVERLRIRIAGDLHDDIGSNLSSIALLSDMVQRRDQIGDRERRHLARISRSARTMVDSLRDIVWAIDPESEHVDDLVRRMKDTASVLLAGIDWTFEAPEDPDAARIDMVVRREVFMAYKEMLHNVARHSRASRVSISLRREGEELRLMVSDDGAGFDSGEPGRGHGLRNIRERAAKVRGHVDIRSDPMSGTRVSLVVPTIRRAG